MTKTFSILFSVNGRNPFPGDMLRHDRCYPSDTFSAMSIVDPERGGYPVWLRTSIEADSKEQALAHAITVKRWESFGWYVAEAKAEQIVGW